MVQLGGAPELAAVHVGGALPVHRPVPLEGEHAELVWLWSGHCGAALGAGGLTVAPLTLDVVTTVVQASAAPGQAVVVHCGALGVLQTCITPLTTQHQPVSHLCRRTGRCRRRSAWSDSRTGTRSLLVRTEDNHVPT